MGQRRQGLERDRLGVMAVKVEYCRPDRRFVDALYRFAAVAEQLDKYQVDQMNYIQIAEFVLGCVVRDYLVLIEKRPEEAPSSVRMRSYISLEISLSSNITPAISSGSSTLTE